MRGPVAPDGDAALRVVNGLRERHVLISATDPQTVVITLSKPDALIEYARNVVGLEDANSSEFDPATPHRVIYKLRELRGDELRKMNQNGMLPLILAHLFSVSIVREIFDKQMQQGKVQPVPGLEMAGNA